MRIQNLFVTAAFSSALLFSGPASAQTPAFDTAAVAAGCGASSGACLAAVQAAIATLRAAGLRPAAINAQIGIIAGIAVSSARSLPASQRVGFSSVLSELAAASTNPAQTRALTQLASVAQSGQPVDLDAVAAAPGAAPSDDATDPSGGALSDS